MTRPAELPDDIDQAAGEWFARRRSGAATPQDARALEAWLEADPAHRAAFDAIERAWAEIEDFRSAPEIMRLRERGRGRYAGFTRIAARRAAAAFAALAVVGGVAVWQAGGASLLGFGRFSNQTYATAVGEKTAVTLPDGSVVTLNTDTVLRTRADRDRRLVYLDKGQAFFRVAHNARRPFIVHAAGRTVTAVGTAFDVRVDARRFEVTLVEGKVRVEAPDPASPARAKPGEASPPPAVRTTEMLAGDQFTAPDPRHWSVSPTDTSRETAWLSGRLKFQGEALGEVAAEFNRYSDRKIVVADPALALRPISGTFQATDEEAFVQALAVAGLAQVRSRSDAQITIAPLQAQENQG